MMFKKQKELLKNEKLWTSADVERTWVFKAADPRGEGSLKETQVGQPCSIGITSLRSVDLLVQALFVCMLSLRRYIDKRH